MLMKERIIGMILQYPKKRSLFLSFFLEWVGHRDSLNYLLNPWWALIIIWPLSHFI